MTRSRMFRDDVEDGREPSPRTTIVGGRPPESGAGLPEVPIGIDRLLRLASVDPAFLAELSAKRGEAADAAGIALTRNERAVLEAIPEGQIAAMVAHLPAPLPERRAFLQQAAASAVVALGGAALASCEGCAPVASRGISPDLPPSRPIGPPQPQGISPDLPPPGPNDAPPPRPDEVTPPTGIAPDLPPPRPDEMPPAPQGSAPEVPPPRPEQPFQTRGITHDVPPPRPAEVPPPAGIAPDRPPPRPGPSDETTVIGGIVVEDPSSRQK